MAICFVPRLIHNKRHLLFIFISLLCSSHKCNANSDDEIDPEEFLTSRGSDHHKEILINVNHVIDYLHSIKRYQEEVAKKVDEVTKMVESSDREEYRNRLKTTRRISVLESKVTEMERTFSVRVEEIVTKKLQEFSSSSKEAQHSSPAISSVPQTSGNPPAFPSPFQQSSYRPGNPSYRDTLPRNSRDISYFEPFRPNIGRSSDSSAISSGFRSVADRQSYLSVHLLEDSKIKMSLMNETLQSFREKLHTVERRLDGKSGSSRSGKEDDTSELTRKQLEDKFQRSEKEISELKSKQAELRRTIDTVLIHFSTLMNGLDEAQRQIEATQKNFTHEIQQVLQHPKVPIETKQPPIPSASALTDTRDGSQFQIPLRKPSELTTMKPTMSSPSDESSFQTVLSNLTHEISSQRQQITKLSSDLARMNISQILLMRTMDDETMKRTIRPKDCSEIRLLRNDTGTAKKYTIFPDSNDAPVQVLCDMETSGGGWTIIQRRGASIPPGQRREEFYRNWTEYKNGFGSLQQDFWLGLETIASLCSLGDQELRIEMSNWAGEKRVALYSHFGVSDSSDKFRLTVSEYSGNAGDSLSRHDGMRFSTKDHDNDNDPQRNCAQMWKGAWWYYGCHESNLNGMYGREDNGGSNEFGTGIIWYHWEGNYYSLKSVTMKIRNTFVVKQNKL